MFERGQWRVRRRFLIPLGMAVLLAVVTLLVRGTNWFIVQPAFERLERLQAAEDASRVWRTIQGEVAQVGNQLGDWANWDDTYEFAETQDPEYIQANLGDWSVLERTSGVNLCFIVNATNAVLYSGAYSGALGGMVTIPAFDPGRPTFLPLLQPVIQRGAPLDGLLMTPYGLMAVAARPILTTEGRGPARGALAFGRFLDAPVIARLGEQTRVAFQLLVAGSGDLTEEEAQRLANQTVGVQEYVRTARGVYIYQVLTDLHGNRAALIRTAVRQEISRVGRETGRVMALALVLALGGMSGAVVLFYIGMGGLISGQTRRDLGYARGAGRLKAGQALWLAASVAVYVAGVAGYAWWSSKQTQADLLGGIDRELLVAAQAQKYVLPADYHDRALKPDSISTDEELALRQRSNRFLRNSNLANVYTVVMREGRLYFTSGSVSPEQERQRAAWYFVPYDDAPAAFRDALEKKRVVFVSYRDEWGEFRSAAVPEVSPGGQPYLACADYDLQNMGWAIQRRTVQNVLVALGFLALVMPFLMVYRRAFAMFALDLRQSEASYRGLFDSVKEAIFILDRAGRFLAVNSGAAAMYGYAAEWFVGKTMEDLTAAGRNDLMLARQALAEAFAGKPQRFEFWGRNSNGKTFPKDVRLYPGTYQGEAVVIKMAEDITERREAEAERLEMERRLLHTQKLESLGVLAGGIAHDFNNLLMAMLGNLDLALADLPRETPARASIDGAISAARRAADLTRQLLAYSGRGKFVVQYLSLAELVQENVHLFRASIARTVRLDLQLAADTPPIEADAAQIQQVVMNLIINAAEAIGERPGTITISTGVHKLTEAERAQNRTGEAVAAGRYASITVADTGCGMDAETQARLFEPFFSTKATGRGLGMPAVLGIVRAHRGAVFVASAAGRGTTLRILFPVARMNPVGPGAGTLRLDAAAPESRPVGRSRGLVLVVDDEESVRRLCARMVERLGFKAITAADGQEAVACFRERGAEITVVLMDLSMPNMDGVAAHKAMLELRPDARIILCSGFSEQEAVQRFDGRGLAGFLQKPYDLGVLRGMLDRIVPP